MGSIEFNRSNYDNCVYIKRLPVGPYMYLLLYVDDMLIVTSNIVEIKKVKQQLNLEFVMKHFGATKRIIGIENIIDKPNEGCIHLTRSLPKRFGMKKAKLLSTPFVAHFRLSKDLCSKIDKDMSHMLGFQMLI